MLSPAPLLLTLAAAAHGVGPDILARDRLVRDLPSGIFAGRKLPPKVKLPKRLHNNCEAESGPDGDPAQSGSALARPGLQAGNIQGVGNGERCPSALHPPRCDAHCR